MKAKKVTYLLCLLLLFPLLWQHTRKKEVIVDFFYTLNYRGDHWQNHRTGLAWTLSYLGATLKQRTLDKSITWQDSSHFKLDFTRLGFDARALRAIEIICDSLKLDAMKCGSNCVDLGQFLALTVGSSRHYYEITGVAKTLNDFYNLHKTKNLKTFPVTKSSVASHQRLLKYSIKSKHPLDWIFIAEEGEGNLEVASFITSAYEAFDIMPNGQLRFAIYDKEGFLVEASPNALGNAGKPAKCIWCHEIVIQPLFGKLLPIPNYISPQEFQEDVENSMLRLNDYRKKLKSEIDFTKTQDHTQMELMYISFMQPSINRLSQEWKMSIPEVEALTKHLVPEYHEEFEFLGKLYLRGSVNRFNQRIPESIREPNLTEPNFFRSQLQTK